MSDYLHNGTREYNCQKYCCKTLEGNSKSKLKDNAKFNITIFDYNLTQMYLLEPTSKHC